MRLRFEARINRKYQSEGFSITADELKHLSSPSDVSGSFWMTHVKRLKTNIKKVEESCRGNVDFLQLGR